MSISGIDLKLTFTIELTRYPQDGDALDPDILADVGIDLLREEFEFKSPDEFVEDHLKITYV